MSDLNSLIARARVLRREYRAHSAISQNYGRSGGSGAEQERAQLERVCAEAMEIVIALASLEVSNAQQKR